MSDKEKEERRVVGRAGNNALASGGLVYASARSVFFGLVHGPRLSARLQI